MRNWQGSRQSVEVYRSAAVAELVVTVPGGQQQLVGVVFVASTRLVDRHLHAFEPACEPFEPEPRQDCQTSCLVA